MRRREFISLLGGASAWPLVARAQQVPMPVIGFLDSRLPDAITDRLRAFRQGLKDVGYVEGENLAIVYRLANNRDDRLPELAADLARRGVAVIATAGTPATLAAKAVSTTIPIVFLTGDDPVRLGLVTSLSRPGGNLTGINIFNSEVTAKRMELLRELVAYLKRIAVLVNPADANTETQLKAVNEAARAMGLQIQVLNADTSTEIDAAFETLGRERPDGVLVGTTAFLNGRRVDELWVGYCGWVSSSWRLYRPHSEGRDAEGPAGRAGKQVRAGYQRTDRTDVWPYSSGPTACDRRRGDRMIKRREFITLLGGAAATWPLAVRAQQAAVPVVGFMSARSPEESAHLVAAFRRGLGEGGFFEGQNVALEFRWARGQYDRLPTLATELVNRGIA